MSWYGHYLVVKQKKNPQNSEVTTTAVPCETYDLRLAQLIMQTTQFGIQKRGKNKAENVIWKWKLTYFSANSAIFANHNNSNLWDSRIYRIFCV